MGRLRECLRNCWRSLRARSCCCSSGVGDDAGWLELRGHSTRIEFSVVNVAGDEIANLAGEDSAGLRAVLEGILATTGRRYPRARILHGTRELLPGLSLKDVGATQGSQLTIIALPPLRVVVQGRTGVLEFCDIGNAGCEYTDGRVRSLTLGGKFWAGKLGLALSPDGLHVLPLLEHTAELWCVSTGRRLHTLRGHEGSLSSGVFSPNGLQCLTSSWDGTARLWSVATGECARTLRGHNTQVWVAAFSPDGLLCLTASHDMTARLWDLSAGSCARVLRGHEGSLLSAVFSPSGSQYLTSSTDKTARLWSAAACACTHVLRGHSAMVESAAFSHDGFQVVTASMDLTARLWKASTAECVRVFYCGGASIKTAAFSADGDQLLTASEDRSARLWNAATGELLCSWATEGLIAAFAPDALDIAALDALDAGQAQDQQEEAGRDVEEGLAV